MLRQKHLVILRIVCLPQTAPPRQKLYKIIDTNGEEVKGTFYEPELQKSSQEVYRIENIVQKKGKKYLVKWLGYPE